MKTDGYAGLLPVCLQQCLRPNRIVSQLQGSFLQLSHLLSDACLGQNPWLETQFRRSCQRIAAVSTTLNLQAKDESCPRGE